MRNLFSNFKREIAFNALRRLFLCICLWGLVGVASFFWNEKKIITIPAGLFLVLVWFVLYRFEIAWRENRLAGKLYFWERVR